MARRGLALGVELDQLFRNLADSATGLALGGLPVRAAHLRQRGLFAADIARQQIQALHRHVELVRGASALARCVLKHHVLAARLILARADGALSELHKPTDAMRVVHDIVAGLQRQRIHATTALRRLAAPTKRAFRDAVTCDVLLGNQSQRATGDSREYQAAVQNTLVDGNSSGLGILRARRHARRNSGFPKLFRLPTRSRGRRRHVRHSLPRDRGIAQLLHQVTNFL